MVALMLLKVVGEGEGERGRADADSLARLLEIVAELGGEERTSVV